MKPLSQVAFLAFMDLRRQLGSPHSAISFVGSIVFVGILFWLMSGFAIDHFLNFAFLMMPLLILAPAMASITSDREAGYAGILFTYPVTATRYYAAKFLAFHLLLAVHFLLLAPYLAIILLYGGVGWAVDIARFAGWAVLETSFVSALGLFLSASFGRRAATASTYVGFGLALVFVIGPWYLPFYIVSQDPETAALHLRSLHFSPLMAALDQLGTSLLVADDPLPAFAATVSVIVGLVVLGLFVYRRLQSPEGWEVGRAKAASVVGLGIVLLLAVPMIPSIAYTTLPSSFGTSGCVQTSTVEYCTGFQRVTSGNFTYPRLGETFQAQLTLSVFSEYPAPVTIEEIVLSWSSRFFSFNVTRAEFGPVDLPADPGPNETSGAFFSRNVTMTALRIKTLTFHEEFSTAFGWIPIRIVADGTPIHFDTAMTAVGPVFNRDLVWVVLGLEAALVLGRRFTRRPRKA